MGSLTLVWPTWAFEADLGVLCPGGFHVLWTIPHSMTGSGAAIIAGGHGAFTVAERGLVNVVVAQAKLG